MAVARNLNELSPGQSGIILSVGISSGAVKRRLIDMGLTPGTEVQVKRIAPFGDPIEVRIRGYELSLRREDALQITIGETHTPQKREEFKPGTKYFTRQLDPQTLERMRQAHEHELDNHTIYYDRREHDKRRMSIALAGNPNCGKTTLFNALTGSNQYVGNWPGVTVEKKEGVAKIGGREVTIVDLPGIYSLSPYSMEEIVTRNFIIGNNEGNEPPDAVINIVDATNIERNMYLTVQLLELERPMVMALNFMDEARKAGDEIDIERLSKEIGIPVVPISAKTGENLEELLHVAHRQMHVGYTIEPDDLYDNFTHEIHHRIGRLIHDNAYDAKIPAHWASIKLIEGDKIVEKALNLDAETAKQVEEIAGEYEAASDLGDRETMVADSRYRYIEKIVKAAVRKGGAVNAASVSDKIDKIVTHRILAVPIFLLMMLVIFAITFGPVGSWLSDGVAFIVDGFGNWLLNALTSINVAPWLVGLITDGIIAGVGGVLTFLPQIALLFFFLSLLEDSGYMARVAFIMDRLLRHFGLSGKAFIPMLMGFGCSVPAIMGARTMENEKDRRMTIMLIPFMSCSAKLPVYGLIAAAFFGAWAGLAIFGLYIFGMLMGILSGIIFKKTVFAGEPAAFVMELPPYRMPSLNNTLIHVWDRVRGFLVKAGTLILIMSVVLWFLQSFSTSFAMVDDSAKSILASVGNAVAPIFKPMGFAMWQAAVALLTGLIAKEAVVASLSMFYGFSLTAGGALVAAAMTGFTPLSAFAFLVFILLYVPCVAAVSTIYKEMNSLKWTALSVGWQILVAYIMSMIVYQLGRLMGF
jgi:ferrous iron transport protein B